MATLTQEAPETVATHAPLISLEGVEKVYRTGQARVSRRFAASTLTIAAGEMVAIVGPSGSGKIDDHEHDHRHRPADGGDRDRRRAAAERHELRSSLPSGAASNVGIVFQFFQLLPTLSALENATLPLDFARRGSKHERFETARHNLELVGLGDKLDHLPAELSGGEQQRVAIARALASDPKLIIGDEPTGNLDTQTAAEMFELLQRLNDEGKTVLYVTHDLGLAARAGRMVTIRDGVVVGQ